VKLVNKTVDDLRKKAVRTASEVEKDILVGTKYILLKNEEDLSTDQKERLDRLTGLNTPLMQAYVLKEDMRQIWAKRNKSSATVSLNSWLKTCRATGEPLLMKLADSIEKHKYGILNWYTFPINSGRIEGINNKIKLLKRSAFGFRDIPFFKLLILAIMRNRRGMMIGPLRGKT
jgi:transposase